MSQHDFDIANQGFAAFRADLNNALKALGSLSSGTAEPATTYANQLWYETDTNTLHIRDEANAAWLDLMVIDQATGSPSFMAGNVGIGTSSPGAKLELATGNAGLGILDATNRLRFTDNDPTLISGQSTGAIEWYTSDTDAPGVHAYIGTLGANTGAADLTFGTGVGGSTSERMRIDSSGNLLVGKTSTDINVDGARIGSFGAILTRSGTEPLRLNRRTSDGDIVKFDKDGTTVGTIGVNGSVFYLTNPQATSDTGVGIASGGQFIAVLSDGTGSDNTRDLGSLAVRWDDVYASNGTIQTSDRNEKQDIEELSEAEQRVAVACKGLLRKFRWISSVAEKGEDARIHFGIIAQDLQAAFAAEGLDAGRYAMFISSTWWEHDGKIYDTAEEAPEGATERTRLGVRYSELLAFMIAVL